MYISIKQWYIYSIYHHLKLLDGYYFLLHDSDTNIPHLRNTCKNPSTWLQKIQRSAVPFSLASRNKTVSSAILPVPIITVSQRDIKIFPVPWSLSCFIRRHIRCFNLNFVGINEPVSGQIFIISVFKIMKKECINRDTEVR
ncbi:hypothetical protein D1872_273410 [compost metagenome]